MTLPKIQQPASAQTKRKGVRAYMATGLGIIGALLGSVGVWAMTTEISGAVVASGIVVVDSSVKKVQHPFGGVVAEIAVKDGDKVEADDLLIRLDETVTKANLQLILRQLDEIAVRQARLRAELRGEQILLFPEEIEKRRDEAHLGEICRTEVELFESRTQSRLGQKEQLAKRVMQLEDEIRGLNAEHKASERELELARTELGGLEVLEKQNLINVTKITASRRLVAQIEGSVAQVAAKIAQARGRISETELQSLQLDQDVKSDAGKELRDTQARAAELSERKIAAEDQLNRMELRAPQAGFVHQLTAHTVGGVISPSVPIMSIVPIADRLVVEAKIPPQSIDQIKVGQDVRVRFSAFSQRVTPEFDATLKRISADITFESNAGGQEGVVARPVGAVSYYVARVELTEAAKSELQGLRLVPGMPAEVYLKTEDRTALSYLVKPLSDQFERAFRER